MGEKTDQKKEEARYHNDYSPRFQPPYDIYDKARNHMKGLKKGEKKREDKGSTFQNEEKLRKTEKIRDK